MSLPTSGQIKISEIANELEVDVSTSLGDLSRLASFTTPDKMSDFYGYAIIQIYYGTIVDDSSTALLKTRPVERPGQPSGCPITINYDISYSFTSGNFLKAEYQINTDGWVQIINISSPGTGVTTGNSISNIISADTLNFRITIDGAGNLQLNNLSGIFNIGTPCESGQIIQTSPYDWSETL